MPTTIDIAARTFGSGGTLRPTTGNESGSIFTVVTNALRICRFAKLLADQDLKVVVATMSLFKEIHSWNPLHLNDYFEVYVKVEPDVLEARDARGLYSHAARGGVMKTTWDYTPLAAHYLKRPDYAASAIDQLWKLAGTKAGWRACDIGAGSGHLTKILVDRGLSVTAVEPNAAMRAVGVSVTGKRKVKWVEGTGEATGLGATQFRLVTFGSSFNTTDRQAALRETARLLEPGGWFACMWNHRDLSDPIQKEVEEFIKASIPGDGYGARREDQTQIIQESGLFGPVQQLEGSYVARVPVEDYVEAWRSHATLHQQAGSEFPAIIQGIASLAAKYTSPIEVGYTTRIWAAQVRSS